MIQVTQVFFPGSHSPFDFACGEFGAVCCEEINGEKSLQHWAVEGGKTQNGSLERAALYLGRQEGREVMERVRQLLLETGVQSSDT